MQEIVHNRILAEIDARKIMKLQEAIKVNLYPGETGVDVFTDEDEKQELQKAPKVEIPLENLKPNEPAKKMARPESKETLKNIMRDIKKGVEMPPLLVTRDGLILDGHHRYFAMKALGVDKAKCIIVPAEDITKVDAAGDPIDEQNPDHNQAEVEHYSATHFEEASSLGTSEEDKEFNAANEAKDYWKFPLIESYIQRVTSKK